MRWPAAASQTVAQIELCESTEVVVRQPDAARPHSLAAFRENLCRGKLTRLPGCIDGLRAAPHALAFTGWRQPLRHESAEQRHLKPDDRLYEWRAGAARPNRDGLRADLSGVPRATDIDKNVQYRQGE